MFTRHGDWTLWKNSKGNEWLLVTEDGMIVARSCEKHAKQRPRESRINGRVFLTARDTLRLCQELTKRIKKYPTVKKVLMQKGIVDEAMFKELDYILLKTK